MAIIKQNKNGTTYVYEVSYYNDNGREKRKWKSLGKLDADGNIIPSKKRASAAATFLNNSQDSLDSANISTNAGTPETMGSNDGNDAIITTTSANANNANNVNNLTTTPIPGSPETSARHAIPATATNNLVAATPATTYVTDSVSNTPNIPVVSDEAPMSAAMSTAESAPVADNIPNNISYDVFAETPAEASITVSNDEPIASQVSEAYE